jgi:hypothetical protein
MLIACNPVFYRVAAFRYLRCSQPRTRCQNAVRDVQEVTEMASMQGLIAVDKKGGKVLFVNPITHETEVTVDGLERNVHELLVIPEINRAYVPVFGDGIHGRNPNPHHLVYVFDLERRALEATIDLRPLSAPHTLRLGPDGMIYVTCENSAAIAIIDRAANAVVGTIDAGSRNCHRMVIAPDGGRLYTENEEDASVSVIDLPGRKLLGSIKTPAHWRASRYRLMAAPLSQLTTRSRYYS